MRLYNLTLEENKLVSAIVNDLTSEYKGYSRPEPCLRFMQMGINQVKIRAKQRGLLLDEVDNIPPIKNIKAIVKEEE